MQGATGPQGIQGIQGEQGIQGPEGPQGPRGYPATVNGISPDDSGNIVLTAGNVNAYSKAETDTLLQNKAPAGYGLGGNGTEVSDWNNATANGFYRDGKGTEAKHSPFVGIWTCGYVTNYSSGALVQVAFGFPFVNGKYVRCEKHRGYHNGGWGEWEWVNPPMELGVEYRTTERYLGKPVYVKVVDVGAMPNTTTKAVNHGIANIDQCISASGITTASSGDTFSMPYVSMSDGVTNGCSFSRTQVRVWSAGDNSTANANVLIKYTKTTD